MLIVCPQDRRERDLMVDLLILEMRDFDVILGMDWLAVYHAFVDCHEKKVVFRIPGAPEFFYQGSKTSPPSLVSVLQASPSS